MKDFLKAQLDKVRENKLRFGFLLAALFVTIIFAVTDPFERGEEIDLEPQTISQVETVPTQAVENLPERNVTPATNGNVKAVIGANADEIYIYDPFKSPAPEKVAEPPKVEVPVKADDKPSTPPEPVIIIQPAPEVPAPPKPPEIKFVLQGVALGENKVAMVQKISEGKLLEMLFVKIGDKLNGKKIADISEDFLTFDDGNRMYFENKELYF